MTTTTTTSNDNKFSLRNSKQIQTSLHIFTHIYTYLQDIQLVSKSHHIASVCFNTLQSTDMWLG